ISNLYAPTTAASAALTLGDAAWGFAVALAAGAVAAWAPARQAAGVRPAAAAALLARIPAVENQPWPGFASALAAVLAWAAATPLLLGLALPALRRRFLARG